MRIDEANDAKEQRIKNREKRLLRMSYLLWRNIKDIGKMGVSVFEGS